MKDPRSGEKLVDQLRHSRPHQVRLLTAPAEAAVPEDGDVVAERADEVDPGFGTGRVVGSERFRRMLDGANDEKDETEDRCGAEGEDCAGGAAGTVDGCGPVATVRSPPEPDLRLEEAAA